MKKMNYFFLIGLFAVVSFNSCLDESDVVSSAITVAAKDSATISGFVTADLDQQSVGYEAVPSGTTLLVSIDYSQFNSGATGKWLKTITVGADGQYTVKVPTNSKGVSVSIIPGAFEYSQKQAYANGAIAPDVKLTYSTSSSSVNIISGQTLSQNIVYLNTTGIAVGAERVTVSGKVQANFNDSIIGLENFPDGTKIIFTATGWADSTTVTAGKYSISVPKGSYITYSINKVISTKVWNLNSTDPAQSYYSLVDKNYSISNSFATSTNYTLDITPSAYTSSVTYTSVTLTGTAKADLDLTVSGNENIPNGTKIYFYTSTWGATATVLNGSYTITVPTGGYVTLYTKFTANKITSATTTVSTIFVVNATSNYLSTGVSTTSTKDLIAY